jgi:hypothetical protein
MKTVATAFAGDKRELASLERGVKTAEQRKALADASKLLSSIHESALKSIHATVTCKLHDDEDVDDEDVDDEDDGDEDDVDDDQMGDHQGDHKSPDRLAVVVVTNTNTASPRPSNGVTFNGDAKAIADQAVAAMTLVVNTVKTQIPAAAAATPKLSPKPTRTPERHVMDNKGKSGEHKDQERD